MYASSGNMYGSLANINANEEKPNLLFCDVWNQARPCGLLEVGLPLQVSGKK